MAGELIEGKDFYYDELGYLIFTSGYLLDRGECCGNGCRHCPFRYVNVPEPRRSELLSLSKNEKK